jgi:hypothetical protein
MLFYFARLQKVIGLQIQSFIYRYLPKKYRAQHIVVRHLYNF